MIRQAPSIGANSSVRNPPSSSAARVRQKSNDALSSLPRRSKSLTRPTNAKSIKPRTSDTGARQSTSGKQPATRRSWFSKRSQSERNILQKPASTSSLMTGTNKHPASVQRPTSERCLNTSAIGNAAGTNAKSRPKVPSPQQTLPTTDETWTPINGPKPIVAFDEVVPMSPQTSEDDVSPLSSPVVSPEQEQQQRKLRQSTKAGLRAKRTSAPLQGTKMQGPLVSGRVKSHSISPVGPSQRKRFAATTNATGGLAIAQLSGPGDCNINDNHAGSTIAPKHRNSYSGISPRPTKASTSRALHQQKGMTQRRSMLMRGFSVPNLHKTGGNRNSGNALHPSATGRPAPPTNMLHRETSTRSIMSFDKSVTSAMTGKSYHHRPVEEWCSAIANHDWEHLEFLLKSYDRKLYTDSSPSPGTKPGRTSSRSPVRRSTTRTSSGSINNSSASRSLSPKPQKSTRKLKIMKLFPTRKSVNMTKAAASTSSDDQSGRRSSQGDDLVDCDDLLQDLNAIDDENSGPITSPLLEQDEQHGGRTPLHLACEQRTIPPKLLQKLLFVERSAASIPCTSQDATKTYPLHAAMANAIPKNSLDRLIYAFPTALWTPDGRGRTPIYHAVHRALDASFNQRAKSPADPNSVAARKRPSKRQSQYARQSSVGSRHSQTSSSSGSGSRKRESDTSASTSHHKGRAAMIINVDDAWDLVDFLCDTFTTRRKYLSLPCEATLLKRAMEAHAPPYTVEKLIHISHAFLVHKPRNLEDALAPLLAGDYPVSNVVSILRVVNHPGVVEQREKWSLSSLPKKQTQNAIELSSIKYQMRRAIEVHFEKGAATREECWHDDAMSRTSSTNSSSTKSLTLPFCDQLLEFEHDKTKIPSKACQDWWYKLWFIVGYCAAKDKPKMIETVLELSAAYILHRSLAIPGIPTRLIQFLVQLFPQAIKQVEPNSGLLPLQMVQHNSPWQSTSNGMDEDTQMILQLLSGRTQDKLRRQMSLKKLHASKSSLIQVIAAGKYKPQLVHTLQEMSSRILGARDVETGFYPFQLASLPRLGSPSANDQDSTTLTQLTNVYQILRSETSVVNASKYGSQKEARCLKQRVGPVAVLALQWCYKCEPTTTPTSSGDAVSASGSSRSVGAGTYQEYSWVVNKTNMRMVQSAIKKGRIPQALKGWWDEVKAQIWRRYRRTVGQAQVMLPRLTKKDVYLLHAAVLDGGTHPMIIDLLVKTNPMSPATPFPKTDMYPLHVACMTEPYAPLPFEKAMVHNKTSIETIAGSYPEAVEDTSRIAQGRMPLHLAVASGKTLNDICILLQYDPNSLSVPDPCTNMLPFEMVACKSSWMSFFRLAELQCRVLKTPLDELSVRRYHLILKAIRQGQEVSTLNSVYLMLRSHPEGVAEACTQHTHSARDAAAAADGGRSFDDEDTIDYGASFGDSLDFISMD